MKHHLPLHVVDGFVTPTLKQLVVSSLWQVLRAHLSLDHRQRRVGSRFVILRRRPHSVLPVSFLDEVLVLLDGWDLDADLALAVLAVLSQPNVEHTL